MYLEDIASKYGMNDYLDSRTGKIYQLSKAMRDAEDDDKLLVPVIEIDTGNLIGYAIMKDVCDN